MKYYELNEDSRNSVHDAIYDGTYNYEETYVGEEIIAKLFEFIHEDIHNLASMLDWNDTEVRDKVCGFIRDNYLELINKVKLEEI